MGEGVSENITSWRNEQLSSNSRSNADYVVDAQAEVERGTGNKAQL